MVLKSVELKLKLFETETSLKEYEYNLRSAFPGKDKTRTEVMLKANGWISVIMLFERSLQWKKNGIRQW